MDWPLERRRSRERPESCRVAAGRDPPRRESPTATRASGSHGPDTFAKGSRANRRRERVRRGRSQVKAGGEANREAQVRADSDGKRRLWRKVRQVNARRRKTPRRESRAHPAACARVEAIRQAAANPPK